MSSSLKESIYLSYKAGLRGIHIFSFIYKLAHRLPDFIQILVLIMEIERKKKLKAVSEIHYYLHIGKRDAYCAQKRFGIRILSGKYKVISVYNFATPR